MEDLNMEKDYTLGLYEKAMPASLSYAEKLLTAKECGFDFVELSVDETDEKLARLDYTHNERQELVRTMFDTGLFFRSICLSGHRKYPLGSADAKTRERGMDIMKKAVDLAGDLGIRIIQLAGYDVYYEDGSEATRAHFLENLIKAVEYAAKAGVLLGFETMETEFMDTVGKAMAYVRAVDSPYLGVYPDLGNLTNAACKYGASVIDDIDSGKGHIVAMHLKETVPGKYREIPFGTGHVDFAAGVQKARELGVRRFVAEMWYTGSADWKNDVKAANKMLCGALNAR